MTEPLRMTVEVAEDGSLTLPAEARRALDLTSAGEVILIQEDAGIRITTMDRIVDHVQALAATYLQGCGSLADELIADRRAEAAQEEAEETAYQAARSHF
ncbi:AbrB family transcriptional regulator [Methylobacterium radiotolerans]|nr:AbrB family transcriptional regulator [Methylobacterium radiotolerans]KTS46347.1 AbrB family transcriptional regulator [Methylobacterium radiotolerans]